MKLSKAAMSTRHVQLGHMTMMKPTQYANEIQAPDAVVVRPRVFSTERYSRSNNGISIPHQLREKIEASIRKDVSPVIKPTPPTTFLSNWGFL